MREALEGEVAAEWRGEGEEKRWAKAWTSPTSSVWSFSSCIGEWVGGWVEENEAV